MLSQVTLKGEIVKPRQVEPEKPWSGICCKRCWYAKHDKCKCKCHGSNHRRGYASKSDNQKLAIEEVEHHD